MAKRTQQDVNESSRHWYQDKYQHVLVQRNMLALIAVVSLIAAAVAAFTVMRLAPLKSVDPYLLQIDEKTGITQKVSPVTRNDYAASEAVDRYFTSTYLRMREGYNFNVLRYNYNVVRVMSTPFVYYSFLRQVSANNPLSVTARLGATGQRDLRITSLIYINNPTARGQKVQDSSSKIIQARIVTTESIPNQPDVEQQWLVTVTFEYANLNLNDTEQLMNPLGYQVTSYQVQREIN